MTQDEIKELAKQAGGTPYVNRHFPGKLAVAFSGQALIDFVALVQQAGKGEVVTPTYDTDLGQFLRTFNIRFEYDGKVFETPIKAVTWLEAEYMLDAIKANGMINNELIEIIE